MMAPRPLRIALACMVLAAGSARAQAPFAPLTRADAVGAALRRGPRVGLARADSAAAEALRATARALPNPVVSLGYSKSVPQVHALAELPLDVPWLRGPRVGSA